MYAYHVPLLDSYISLYETAFGIIKCYYSVNLVEYVLKSVLLLIIPENPIKKKKLSIKDKSVM